MHKRFKKESSLSFGFTLIELLVVIAIIGILASVVIISLNSARAKGRDAKRLAEIRQIQTALELYYSDNGQYPPTCASSSGAYVANWPNLLAPAYMPQMPNDPINTVTQYGYYYCAGYQPAGNCSFTYPGVNTTYILAARLENPSASTSSCSGTFSGWDSGVLNYIVGK